MYIDGPEIDRRYRSTSFGFTSTASLSTRQVKGNIIFADDIITRLKCPFKKVKDTLFEFWDSILPKENVTIRALLLVNPNIIDVAVEDNGRNCLVIYC